MIRLIQRRLIIPRGDTGTFQIPMLPGKNAGDVSIFTVFDPLSHRKLLEKSMTLENEVLSIQFSHNDTVNLPVGQFVWDIKFYSNPVFADGKLVDGEEIDSYYAAFTLPVCEIRQTGDLMLMVNDAALPPDQLDILLATLNATIAAKDEAVTSAAEADTSATNAENSASAAALAAQTAQDIETSVLAAQETASAAAVSAQESATLAAQKAAQIETDLESKADKSEIPTLVSQLENDAGYLTSFTETDPTVPSWAKQAQKPSYTAQEVGALPVDTVIPTVPTNVSAFINDVGYLTEHQDISGKANVADLATVATSGSYEDLSDKPTIPDIQINGSSIVNNGVANIPYAETNSYGLVKILPTNTNCMVIQNGMMGVFAATTAQIKNGATDVQPITPRKQHGAVFYGLAKVAGVDLANEEVTVGIYPDSAKTAIQQMLGVPAASAIPTSVSQLTNDAGYLTTYTETDPTVPSWAKAAQKPTYTAAEVGAPTVQEMNTAIGNAIGNINSFDMAVVQALPTEDISTHTIYLVPKTGETNDVYDEYVYINNAWEMVGNTQVDLSNYVQKTDYASNSNYGVVQTDTNFGINSVNGVLSIGYASTSDIKAATNYYKPIGPRRVKHAAFYGLAQAAGDTTQSQSDNAVGTYTTEAKAAIRSMIGAAASADVTVQDVQINGTSILSNNVANIPVASSSSLGTIKVVGNGIGIDSGGAIYLSYAGDTSLKAGNSTYAAITTTNQHKAVFYGLAKAAGDTTQSQSNNAIGTYTSDAKAAIQTMLGVASADDVMFVPGTGEGSTKIKDFVTTDNAAFASTATGLGAFAEGPNSTASGAYAHAENLNTTASGINSHSEGNATTASGMCSHAEGQGTTASKTRAHAEGYNTTASGANSHAEGYGNTASGNSAHVEGRSNTASGQNAHVEGQGSIGTGMNSHTEGFYTIGHGQNTHVEGMYNVEDTLYPTWISGTEYHVGDNVINPSNNFPYKCIIANSDIEFTTANWENIVDNSYYVHIVGNGNYNARSNAYALDWKGNGHYMGNIYVGANADSTGGTRLATITELAAKLDAAEAGLKVVRLI